MKLLLFDIDGTLVRVNGRGREAINEALSSLTDHPISLDGVPFSGRTDPAIIEAVLAHNNLPTTDAMIAEVIATYVETMRGALRPADVEVLPGVADLLQELHARSDVRLGLVTGNVEPIAYEKLAVHGLDDYFPVGAFGSDHAERSRLPKLATQRAADHTSRTFRPAEHAVVIGDTPHDIECARAAGARVVAVCTGRYGRDDLSPHDPDLLLDTLSAPDSFPQRVLDM
jgi:phosphoglycolate phosphatase-like HAD superfamily hydrolase